MPKQMPSLSKGASHEVTDTTTSKALAREGIVSFQYSLLTRSNYAVWAIKIKVYIKAQGVWEAINWEDAIHERKD